MNVIKVLGLTTNVNVGLGSSVPDQNNLGADVYATSIVYQG
jgi:hypothetical protein